MFYNGTIIQTSMFVKEVVAYIIFIFERTIRELTENNLRILLALLSVFYVAVTVV